jgi:hypothetical protein
MKKRKFIVVIKSRAIPDKEKEKYSIVYIYTELFIMSHA